MKNKKIQNPKINKLIEELKALDNSGILDKNVRDKISAFEYIVLNPFILEKIYKSKDTLRNQDKYDHLYFYGTITESEVNSVIKEIDKVYDKVYGTQEYDTPALSYKDKTNPDEYAYANSLIDCRECILHKLRAFGIRKQEFAKLIGISRSTFYVYLADYSHKNYSGPARIFNIFEYILSDECDTGAKLYTYIVTGNKPISKDEENK